MNRDGQWHEGRHTIAVVSHSAALRFQHGLPLNAIRKGNREEQREQEGADCHVHGCEVDVTLGWEEKLGCGKRDRLLPVAGRPHMIDDRSPAAAIPGT